MFFYIFNTMLILFIIFKNLDIQQPIKVIVDHLEGNQSNNTVQNNVTSHSLNVLSSENLSNNKRCPALYFSGCTSSVPPTQQFLSSAQQSPLLNQNIEVNFFYFVIFCFF